MLYLPIEKESIPYTFQTTIGGEDFEITVGYNERFDYFTLDLAKDGRTIILGEKITYGRALFEQVPDDTDIPRYPITPLNISKNKVIERVGWDELSIDVLLVIGDPNG